MTARAAVAAFPSQVYFNIADAFLYRAEHPSPRVHVYRVRGPLASGWVVMSERHADRLRARGFAVQTWRAALGEHAGAWDPLTT